MDEVRGSAAGPEACAFYCVANDRHFIGAVALFNSLRLLGHHEPFHLVDAGLTDDQRALVAGRMDILPAPPGVPPVHLAPHGPRRHPAEVQVVLDADLIVTRPLTELIEAGRAGRLVGFVNDPPNHDRFFPEWGPALGLGPLRRRPYLNAGQFVLPRALNEVLLDAWIDGQERTGTTVTRYGHATLSDPFYFADQDVVNAVIAAGVPDDALDVREHRLAPHPPFRDLVVRDALDVVCEYPDGTRPFFLHHTMQKPWLGACRSSVYSTLLSRLLVGDGLALPLDPASIPLRLREGRLAAADRFRADRQRLLRDELRRRLGVFGVRTRLAARRARSARAT
jgi:hypothetical protein